LLSDRVELSSAEARVEEIKGGSVEAGVNSHGGTVEGWRRGFVIGCMGGAECLGANSEYWAHFGAIGLAFEPLAK
jgi:hypothetical protein